MPANHIGHNHFDSAVGQPITVQVSLLQNFPRVLGATKADVISCSPWGFGAGLILGFSICAGETRCDLNEAFSGALHLLTKIGESSPQSKLYSETLKSFADSISLYQRLTFHKARRSAEQYVEQVFVIDLDEEVSWPPVGAPDLASLLPTGWDSLLPMSDLVGNEDPGFTLPTDLDEHMLDLEGWGDLGTQFSDNFAIDLGAGLL